MFDGTKGCLTKTLKIYKAYRIIQNNVPTSKFGHVQNSDKRC